MIKKIFIILSSVFTLSCSNSVKWSDVIEGNVNYYSEPINKLMLYFAMEDDGLIDFSYDVFLEKLKTEQYRKSCFYILMQNKYEYIVDISAIRGLSGAEAVQYDLDARPANLTYKEFNDNLFIEESLRTTFDKRKIINLYGFCCNWAECSPQQFAKKMESEEYSQVVYEFIKSRVSAIGFPKTRDDFTNELKCQANN